MSKQWTRRMGLLALSAAVLTGLAACDKNDRTVPGAPSVSAFNAVDITGADYARQFSLKDGDGKTRTLAEFKGKVVFVFFGFTQCPDVCPTTMADLAEVHRRLGPQGDRLQGVFITVDPERDTPAVLKNYVRALDPSFVGLTGSQDQINEAAREFKIFFQKVPTKDGQSYTMDHTAGAFVFDPQGRTRLFARYGLGADALTADIKRLLSGS
ncbi:MAG: SCO family protein [Burkholderiales bacterium]|nr:SCO family protein [Burkholderiales bacterium]